MHMTSKTLLAFALPLTLTGACGGDDGDTDPTGAETSVTVDPDTSAGPGTTPITDTDGPGTTTDDPDTTTDDPDTTTNDPDTTGAPDGDASVRVMHLGVNAPGVDVYANEGAEPVFENLEFGNSSEYVTVPAAAYTFDVTATGTPIEDAVLTVPLTLAADTAYTAVAIGDIGAATLQVIALVDDRDGIAAGDIRIQVIHAAPGVPPVDIWEISGAEPVELLSDVPFGEFETLPDIEAGPLVIGIDVDNDAEPDLVFNIDATGLAGAQVNVYASSDANENVSLIAQLEDGTTLEFLPE